MKNAEEKEAIIDQFAEILENTSIVDKHDLVVVSLAVIGALAFSIAKAPAQLSVAEILAKALRETIERADPDATALQ